MSEGARAVSDLPTIHYSMAAVLAELPAIGKNQQNSQQNYRFRGIDDVLDALNPLLGRHGVFFVPEVVERLESDRQTRNGGTMWVVNLHIRYRFYGPAGDYVEASGWGEGTDSGDKATQKAMTAALKYVLFQVFAIATTEQHASDSDNFTPEETISPSKRAKLKSRCIDLGTGMKAAISERRAAWNLPTVDKCDEKQLGLFGEMLDELEAELEKPFVKDTAGV